MGVVIHRDQFVVGERESTVDRYHVVQYWIVENKIFFLPNDASLAWRASTKRSRHEKVPACMNTYTPRIVIRFLHSGAQRLHRRCMCCLSGELMRGNNGAFFSCGFLQICCTKNSCFACCIAKDYATFLRGLDVTLVETADAITDRDKTKLFFVEDV